MRNPKGRFEDLASLQTGESGRAALPVPAFRCGSQKSPWLVNVEDLADYIESQRRQALQEWQKVNGITHRLS